jgi:hypothetical protein
VCAASVTAAPVSGRVGRVVGRRVEPFGPLVEEVVVSSLVEEVVVSSLVEEVVVSSLVEEVVVSSLVDEVVVSSLVDEVVVSSLVDEVVDGPVVTVVNGPAIGGFDLPLLDAASTMPITPNTTSTTKLAMSSAARRRRLGSGSVGEGALSMPPSPACRAQTHNRLSDLTPAAALGRTVAPFYTLTSLWTTMQVQ